MAYMAHSRGQGAWGQVLASVREGWGEKVEQQRDTHENEWVPHDEVADPIQHLDPSQVAGLPGAL